jgi:hypothetical protein
LIKLNLSHRMLQSAGSWKKVRKECHLPFRAKPHNAWTRAVRGTAQGIEPGKESRSSKSGTPHSVQGDARKLHRLLRQISEIDFPPRSEGANFLIF